VERKEGGPLMLFQRKSLILVTVISLFLTFPVLAQAQGKITINPLITTSWQVDSNYYKAQIGEREVYTYLLQPGIILGYETAKSVILLNYTLDAYYYDDQDPVPAGQTATDENDFVGHTINLSAATKPFDRLTLGLDESFIKTRDPGASDIFNNEVDRDKYFINRLTPRILYEFENRFSLQFRYNNTETDYDPANREDSTENRGMFDVIYNLSRTSSLDLEYQQWNRDYDLTTSDYDSDQFKLIFRKQFKYFSIEAGGGYHEREFDAPTLADLDVFTYRVAFIGQMPPAPDEPRSNIAFIAEQNFNDSGTGENYFESLRLTLSAGHVFMEKIKANLMSYYQSSPYERSTSLSPTGALRDDDTFHIEAGIGYMFTDWLTFGINGGYEDRESNVTNFDYDNKFFMAKLEFNYNLGKQK